MSYEWIRRRRRYLGFRYLFPELVAPWIQFKRGLLRLLWFFTHPMDEFIEDVGELLVWPFVMLARFCTWVLTGIREFFKDLYRGIEVFVCSLGRLPVWTGSAIAGTLGIIMTILLFFLQVATFDPVPLSTGAAGLNSVANVSAMESVPDPGVSEPELVEEDVSAAPVPESWRPTPPPLPQFSVQLSRLEIPFSARQRIEVVSSPVPSQVNPGWTHFDRLAAVDGWQLTQPDRAHAVPDMTPYVMRRPAQSHHADLNWVVASASIGPFTRVENQRQPAVSIVRTAPERAPVGGSLVYELLVSNRGSEPLDSVRVREIVSAIDRVIDVHPPARVVDDVLVWDLSDLQPEQERRLTIELKPDELVPVSGGSIVRVTTGIGAVSHVDVPAQRAPAMTPEPKSEPEIFLTEPESRPAPVPREEIGMILPTFHDEPEFEPPPQQSEPAIEPEPVVAKPAKPAPAILPLTPPSRPVDEPEVAVNRPAENVESATNGSGVPIFFEMRTPTQVDVESPVRTTFEIRNPGRAPLTDLVILVEVTSELDHQRGRILEHRIERLEPGAAYQTRLTTSAIRSGTARVRSTLTSAEDLQSTLQADIEVSPQRRPQTQLSAIVLPVQCRPTSTQ